MTTPKATAEHPTPMWHCLTTDQALLTLASAPAGLGEDDVCARRAKFGFNRLPQAARQSALARFLIQFHHLLIYVLLGSAVITALLRHWVDTLVILAVVVANAIVGFLQEQKAEKALDAIRHMLAPHANVIRNGTRMQIDGEHLVPGDIVLLEAGDKVPADLRLLASHALTVQEAILTGESVPVEKHTDAVAPDAAIGDRSCMCFSGTMVTAGQGFGVVTDTGTRTEIGRIGKLLDEVETLTTPLVAQMGLFAKWLTVFILLVAGLLVAWGYFVQHHDFAEMFMAVVGLSVAAIPEGLPAVLSITLAVGVQAMARRNAIVRRLPAIETLGSVSVICTDKTGTLTLNEMMVASVVTAGCRISVDGQGYRPEGELHLDAAGNQGLPPSVNALAQAAALCNDAELHQRDGVWHVEGDPMEGALVVFSAKAGVDATQQRAAWRRVSAIPFDASHRFMATLNRAPDGTLMTFVKGAPEQVIAMCSGQRAAGETVEPIDADYWREQSEAIATLGQRVLAMAIRSMPSDTEKLVPKDLDGALTLLGLVGMIDPPRSEAVSAIAECHAAGIRVKMITGDHALTARAIARQIGLNNPDTVITGPELDRMDEGRLQFEVLDCDIFARTSPAHKLRLVKALQAHRLTVAMTGDGVNDAPALRRADAGIAMGRKGSEAAKEAAELVLIDDNFASIVAAVREGRTVYDNIKKVISWTLPTNAGEAMTIIVALLFGLTLPITPVQILWINLITAVTLGMALAFEPTEQDTMRRPPRSRAEPLLSGTLVWHVVLVSALFLCGVYGIYLFALDRGYPIELARTLAVNTLVVMEVFHLFFIRNFYSTSLTWKAARGTRVVWLVVLTVTLAQFAITYLPPLQAVFATQAVPLLDGALVIAIGVMLFAILEAEKQLRLRLNAINMPSPTPGSTNQ